MSAIFFARGQFGKNREQILFGSSILAWRLNMSIQLVRRAFTAAVIFASVSLILSTNLALAESEDATWHKRKKTGDAIFSVLELADIKPIQTVKDWWNWTKLVAAVVSTDSAEAGKAATEISARLHDDNNQSAYGKALWTFVQTVGYCRGKISEKCEEKIETLGLYALAVALNWENPASAIKQADNFDKIGKWVSLAVVGPAIDLLDQFADRHSNSTGFNFTVAAPAPPFAENGPPNEATKTTPGNANIRVDPALTRTGRASSQFLVGGVFQNAVVPGTTTTPPSTATKQQLKVSRLNDDALIDPATGKIYKQFQLSGQLDPAINFIIPPELLTRNTPSPVRDMTGASLMPTSLPFVPNIPGPPHTNAKIKPALLGNGKSNLRPPTAMRDTGPAQSSRAPQPAVAVATPDNSAPTTDFDPPAVNGAPQSGSGLDVDQAIDLLNGLAGVLGTAGTLAPSGSYSPPTAVRRPSPPALQRIPRQTNQSTITGN